MSLKIDVKFEEKLSCDLENDMRNLAYFYQSTQKFQNQGFDGILYAKQKIYGLKVYRGVMCHDNEK